MLERSPETLAALRGLRVVRNFTSEPIRESDLQAILDVARWTGSSKNRQSWLFLVMSDRQKLDALARCGSFSTPIRNAPLVIAPIGLPDAYEWDLGRVSQNIMLAAAAVGVGSCPVTLHDQECARQTLGLPDGHSCKVVVAAGYPDEEAEKSARSRNPLSGRKTMEDVVRFERLD